LTSDSRKKAEAQLPDLYPDIESLLPISRIASYSDDVIHPVLQGYYLVDCKGRQLTTVLPITICDAIHAGLIENSETIDRRMSADGKQGILLAHIVIPLNPPSKKNSQSIVNNNRGRPFIIPNLKYRQCIADIKKLGNTIYQFKREKIVFPIETAVRVVAHYYRDSHRRIDGTNLESAMADILVTFGVLKDDDSKILNNTDGRRVYYDRERPRTELWIYEWRMPK
jgi:hypothetical protein